MYGHLTESGFLDGCEIEIGKILVPEYRIAILFLEKSTLTVLNGLKSIAHLFDHTIIFSKSSFKELVTLLISHSTVAYSRMSSANSLMQFAKPLDISFICNKNKKTAKY